MIINDTKIFTFDCAHRITGHDGQCDNIHGHTYKLEVTIASDVITNMVMDFKKIKDLVNKTIINDYDHSLVLWTKGDNVDGFLKGLPRKITWIEMNATAENMLLDMYVRLQKEFVILVDPAHTWVDKMRLWETPTSYAELITDHSKRVSPITQINEVLGTLNKEDSDDL